MILKKLINFIYELFQHKKHETFVFHEYDNFCGVQCKNCEEYLGRDSGEIHPHGKWKSVSNHWKNYVKTNVLWKGKKTNIKKEIYLSSPIS